MTLQPGTRLGPYEIVAAIGAGGMGEVYRARDTKLDRDVAIKVLPTQLADSPEALGRLEREAKAVAALSHPNILAIHDFGKIAGVTFAVMELLEGETLRERMAAGALPVRKAVDLGVQIARGLGAAHEKGIVHRDLKPENIFLTRDGRAKILDFGLAKAVAAPGVGSGRTLTTPPASATEAGTVLGTAGYMAPEQVRGAAADHRSDVFSFGVVLYEMLAGRRAFTGDSGAEVMTAILREEPPDLASSGRHLPPALALFVHRCLEKDPAQRFQSARDLAFGLEAISVESVSGSQADAGTAKRRPVRWWLPAAGAAAVAAGAAVGFAVGRRGASGPVPHSVSVRQLTFASGLVEFPTVSPDGGTFAFVGDSSGRRDVFLQRIGGQNPISLTAGDDKDDTQPVFSPAGDAIAYRSERDGGGIFLMGATGENRRRLTDFGYQPAWSPDGKEVVVATEGVDEPLNRNAESQLWAIDVASGAKRLVFKGDAVQPSWSPHGHRIAYWAIPTGGSQRDIWTVPAAGEKDGLPVAVTSDRAVDWNPAWSQDGRYLYFASDRGGSFNVWRVPVEERSGRPLGAPEPVTVPATEVGEFSLGRNGTTVVFQSRHYVALLERVPFDPGSGKAAGPGAPILRSSVELIDPDLSPDGSTVVMRSFGSKEDVLLIRTDGSNLRKLTDDGFRNRGPAWSPDGTRIAFYSDRGGAYDLWTIRADGSGLTRLMKSPLNSPWYPRWSPDGKRLSCGSDAVGYVIPTDSPPGQAVAQPLPPPGPGVAFYPYDWSPDGAALAGSLGTGTDQPRGIGVYTLATQAYRKVSDSGDTPRWLPDGRRLLYLEHGQVWVADVRTGERHLAIASPPGEPINDYVAVSKDGRAVYLTRTLVQNDIWEATLSTGK